ncbi:N-acetyltransferase [Xinfangfangia sp. D13-10-4-6]|uniref:GNAT family N-acetyltransferase n=1 Tax=Pseudogemmobacter hezensis TaxID=2737662 RepID=UPI001557C430|nr:GNAT family N-acetyltransferase [Pseudogemmobacter hezensis]NPD15828.1 N-acetyltransferase [Pseudogemmobacter hezensis]
MMPDLRDARPEDAAGIAEIYNHAVIHTTAIWNDSVVDADNRRAWIASRQADGFPVLVAIIAGQVAGYASYGSWRAFAGYRLTVENSVYVAEAFRGQGIAAHLMQALIARARGQGLHMMIAAIEANNQASQHLHRKFGYQDGPLMREVGQKFGRWLDLQFMTLRLDQRSSPNEDPAPL